VSAATSLPEEQPAPCRRQRICAYGVLRSVDGATLLVRASCRSALAGRWFLPGGGVRHGEEPSRTVVREIAEETGLGLEVVGLRDVVADLVDLPGTGIRLHTVRLLYDVRPHPGANWCDPQGRVDPGFLATALRPEVDGTSDVAALVPPDRLAALPLMPFVADALGLPVVGAPDRAANPHLHPVEVANGNAAEPPAVVAAADEPTPVAAPRVQRPAAYALVTHADRVLLTRLRHVEGMWTLPGGGIGFGEHPRDAVVREVHEETGLPLTVAELLDVDSRHFTGYSPDGRLEDFHGVRVLYAGTVPVGRQPRVVEIGGTTDAVAWVDLDRLPGLPLTALAATALRRLRPDG
jgi:ADP-ribose pyrophosphatase YjhB (NUDIX family)